jgi:branched-chain amino acid aminotransferase
MSNVVTDPKTDVAKATSNDLPMVYVNGKMQPKSQASVNVFDHGLLYGDGVFEGIRVYKGKIFKSEQHMDRLYACANAIRIDLEKFVSREEMVKIQRDCIETNNLVDGYIRLVVTRGVGTLGLHPFKCPEPGIICIADQIQLFPSELYEQGMRVVVAERPRIPIECLDPRVKSLNYLNNIMAKVEAIDAGCLECIMLNTEGFIAEGSGDNIFIVKDGEIFTPPSEAGILEGITRRFVINELAPLAGVEVTEKNMRLEDAFDADEIFLTGSAAEVIGVTRIGKTEDDAHVFGNGSEGPITKSLRMKFRQIVTGDNVPED